MRKNTKEKRPFNKGKAHSHLLQRINLKDHQIDIKIVQNTQSQQAKEQSDYVHCHHLSSQWQWNTIPINLTNFQLGPLSKQTATMLTHVS